MGFSCADMAAYKKYLFARGDAGFSDGKTLSQGSVLFTQPKYYAFQNPNLRCDVKDGELTIYSDAYAKCVWVEGVDGDVILDDNGFDMEKGCKKVRILSGSAEKFTLKSVYDIR